MSGLHDNFRYRAGGAKALRTSARYYMDTPSPFVVKNPNRVAQDGAGNLYFTDGNNHSIWEVNTSGDVTRVAGIGTSGFSGDGGPALLAQFNNPQGLFIDSSRNIYVADTQNNRVRRISVATGMVSTVAGTGTAGSAGDGGPATSAQLRSPGNIALDGQGNLLIADTGNNKIRKVSASTSTISTIAGTGVAGYNGDNINGTTAQLNQPSDVCPDPSGNIFIADTQNHLVRKINTSGVISRIAGTPQSPGNSGDNGSGLSARLNQPNGLSLDQTATELYVADTRNNRVRRVHLTSGNIHAYAGNGYVGWVDGYGSNAEFDLPEDVLMTASGTAYVADSMNCTLRTVDTNQWVSTLAVAPGTGLNSPSKVAAYYSASAQTVYLYIADTSNNRIRKFDTTANTLVTVAGTGTAGYWGDGGAATSAALNGPQGIAVDGSGNIYFSDTQNCIIRKIDTYGNITRVMGQPNKCSFADGAANSAMFNDPQGLFVTSSGDIYVADTNNHALRKLHGGIVSTVAGMATKSGYTGDGGAATSARLKFPTGVYVDGSNNIYIADTWNGVIRTINTSLVISTVPGATGFGWPTDVYADSAGNLIVADSQNNGLYRVTAGVAKVLAGVPNNQGFNGDNIPAASAQMNSPSGIAVAGSWGRGRVYVGDSGNNRIRVLSLRIAGQLY